ncbi:MAG TPA: Ig-like domain-containing protein [Gemmatimonadaceae bacterium]|nr:Ig-like domain-containing protein [Gemmatimonadaceae bacterium]
MLLLRTRLSTLGLMIVAGALSACSLNTEVLGVGQVSVSTGDNQTAPANTVFPQPLAVLVVSQFGEPMENVEVSWTIASGGGSLSSATTLTDANGLASVTYTAGPTPGHASIVAQVNGVEPLSFDETIT